MRDHLFAIQIGDQYLTTTYHRSYDLADAIFYRTKEDAEGELELKTNPAAKVVGVMIGITKVNPTPLYMMDVIAFNREKGGPYEPGLRFNEGDLILDRHGLIPSEIYDYRYTNDLVVPLDGILKTIAARYERTDGLDSDTKQHSSSIISKD